MLVDTKGLAESLYNVMDDDAKALMAFGMIDKKYTDCLELNIQNRLDEIGKEKNHTFDEVKRKKFVNQIVSEVSIELYSVAKMVV